MDRTRWLGVLLAIALVAGLALVTRRDAPSTTQEVQRVSVGTWKTAQTIAPFGYQRFLEGQYEVEVLPFTNPGDQKTALLAGSLRMCGTTLVHAITSASRGEPVVLVAAQCDKCSALAVRKNSEIRDPADLRGKKIGYVPSTMHDLLLRETLTRAGLDPLRDVKLVRIDFFDMGQALSTGAIDAFLSGEPFPTMAKLDGYGRILSYPYFDDSIGTLNAGMLVTRREIEENPGLVQDLVTAHALATEYYSAHPEEWLSAASEFGTPLEILKEAAENIALTWKMDEKYLQAARNLGKQMLALGMITQEPDYDQLFDLRFQEEAARAVAARRGEWRSQ
jgi:NitT/TauT family transport system substrate-binding protein